VADQVTWTGPLLAARDVSRTFGAGETAVHAVRGVTLEVPRGQLLVVRGRSGSGKTTLLNCLGGLETPDSGHVLLGCDDLATMSADDLVQLRRHRIGYVFQSFGLLPILSAAENVGVPLRLAGVPAADRERRVAELLSMVGLADHVHQRPYELSGGQQQRVAIARALANEPELLIADEPTGQLDSATGRAVMDMLRRLVHHQEITAVVATHDPVLLGLADRVVELSDGVVVSDSATERAHGRHRSAT
jgi:putative ABC transport system ATP-binding protein